MSTLLVLGAIAVFAYPAYTDVVARSTQHRLAGALTSQGEREAYRRHAVQVGHGLTRLRIRRLGIDVLVVEGTTLAALKAGAGHYVSTPLPGERGNVGIAGHRTTYGRPFNRLDELRPGDVVVLDTPFDEFVYRLVPRVDGHANPWVVAPDDFSVVGQGTPGHWLTLTTCTPKGSARQRLVARFELVTGHALASGGTS